MHAPTNAARCIATQHTAPQQSTNKKKLLRTHVQTQSTQTRAHAHPCPGEGAALCDKKCERPLPATEGHDESRAPGQTQHDSGRRVVCAHQSGITGAGVGLGPTY